MTGLGTGRSGVRIQAGSRDYFFFRLQKVQSVSGAHPASYDMGIDHLPPSSAEINNGCRYGPHLFPLYTCWREQGRINLCSVDRTVTRLRTARSGVRIPAESGHFYHLRNVQSVSGAHPASYDVGTGGHSRR